MTYQVEISANLLSWPQLCACCYEPAQAHAEVAATRISRGRTNNTQTRSWRVPYCRACLAHRSKRRAAGPTWTLVGGILGCCVWLALYALLNVGVIAFLGGMLAAVAMAAPYSVQVNEAKAMLKESCCASDDAVRYITWHGTVHTFQFKNKNYLDRFLELNSKKNRSGVWKR